MGCAGSKPTQPVQGRDSRSALRGPSPDLTSEHHVVASDSSKGADSKTRVHKLRVSVGSVSGLASLNNYVVVSHRDLGARTRVVYGSKSPAFNEVVDIVTVHEPRDVDVSVRTYNVRLVGRWLRSGNCMHAPGASPLAAPPQGPYHRKGQAAPAGGPVL